MKRYHIGEVIKCTVSGIEPYGVFVNIDKNFNGLIHISEVSNEFVMLNIKYAELALSLIS